MTMVYKWKVRKFPVSAQDAGKELERIEQEEGFIKPESVVDHSRPEGAPLHDCFEWDNDAAAEEYRKVQAREIIRFIEIVHEEDGEEQSIRAYWSTFESEETDENDEAVKDDKDEEDDQGEEGPAVKVTHQKKLVYRSINTVLNTESQREYVIAQALRELESFERKYRHLTEFAGVMKEIDKVKQQSLQAV